MRGRHSTAMALTWLALGGAACGATPAAAPAADVATAQDATVDQGDTALPDAATATAPSHLVSLKNCWNDMGCHRAFVISHGGDWKLQDGLPYDSKGAFLRAFANGADGIKTDVHVTKDNVAFVAHSSPIEFWESEDCNGMKVEELTAAEMSACHIFPSETETFQRVDDVLEWARGKLVIMLTVKKPKDFARAIEIVLEHGAQDYVFLETRLGELQTVIPATPHKDEVFYNAELGGPGDVPALLQTAMLPRVLFCELDTPDSDPAKTQQLIEKTLHPAGMRAFVSSMKLPSVAQHKALFETGFDVVMSYDLVNGVAARIEVNQARGISPP